MNKQSIKLVLASSSPYRKQLLQQIGLTFTCHSPEIDERRLPNESPKDMVERLAIEKAIASSLKQAGDLFLGSDQIAIFDHQILGKPGNFINAREQLLLLSNRQVKFLTSVCLYEAKSKEQQVAIVPTLVHFRKLSSKQVEDYLTQEEPFGCCGSFKAEGLGIALFKSIQSEDPSALIGLPLIQTISMLERKGLDPLLYP